jgi:hypothetical protein
MKVVKQPIPTCQLCHSSLSSLDQNIPELLMRWKFRIQEGLSYVDITKVLVSCIICPVPLLAFLYHRLLIVSPGI